MKNIELIYNNLKIETTIEEKDIVFYDVKKEPFNIYGLYNYKAEGKFMRLPEDVAKNTNERVSILNYNTAGGRVRFKTNSKHIA